MTQKWKTKDGKASNWRYRLSNGYKYARARQRAIERGYEFSISIKEHIELRIKPCHYCGTKHNTRIIKGKIIVIAMSVDRKDNNKGYIAKNVVPCCHRCNLVKGSMVTYSSMIKIGKILKKQDKALLTAPVALDK